MQVGSSDLCRGWLRSCVHYRRCNIGCSVRWNSCHKCQWLAIITNNSDPLQFYLTLPVLGYFFRWAIGTLLFMNIAVGVWLHHCFHVSGYFVEVGFPNIGELFNRFIPEGLPAEVRILPLSTRLDWFIMRGVPLCARFPSTSTRYIPEGLPEVVEWFHKRPCSVLLFLAEL